MEKYEVHEKLLTILNYLIEKKYYFNLTYKINNENKIFLNFYNQDINISIIYNFMNFKIKILLEPNYSSIENSSIPTLEIFRLINEINEDFKLFYYKH